MVRFKQVDYSKSGDLGTSLVLFNHDVYGVSPASQDVAFLDDQLEESGQTGEKSVVLNDSFAVSKMAARG